MQNRWQKDDLDEIVKNSYSRREVLTKLGLSPSNGNNGNTLTKYLREYNISTVHFIKNYQKINDLNSSKKIDLDDILKENSDYNRGHLKKRLYKEGLKIRECELCGQNEIWMGKRMSLILDHINGTHNDNRIENLRIVCPNCNATLPTHCGRNIYNKNKFKKVKCIDDIKNELENKTKFQVFSIYGETYTIKRMISEIERLNILKESEIDFSKFGWVSKAAKIIGVKDQVVNRWLKRVDPEFYKMCFIRK